MYHVSEVLGMRRRLHLQSHALHAEAYILKGWLKSKG